MEDIYFIADFVSIMGIICYISPKINQFYKIYTTDPLLASDISTTSIMVEIFTNLCLLFYMVVNNNYTIIIHCSLIILLNISYLFMKRNIGVMKKSSSQENLVEMDNI